MMVTLKLSDLEASLLADLLANIGGRGHGPNGKAMARILHKIEDEGITFEEHRTHFPVFSMFEDAKEIR